MKAYVVQKLLDAGVIPIVRVNSSETAVRLSEAILQGGAGTVEIPFTVPGAANAIETLRSRHPDLLIGAGTILDEAAARTAVNAGAHYLVSVGMFPDVVRTGHRYGLPVFPGVMTPTEAVQALELGADALKLFPASHLGVSFLKALAAPLPQAIWCPTGGVDLNNLSDWVRAGAKLVGVGSPLLRDVERTGDTEALIERTRQFMVEWRRAREA